MCLIVTIPKGAPLDEDRLFEGFLENSDGAGFAYASGGRLRIEKGWFEWAPFWKRLQSEHRKGHPLLVHFRLSTSGGVSKDMCHPFRLDRNTVIAHNGVFPGLGNGVQSDTSEVVGILRRARLDWSNPNHAALLSLLDGGKWVTLHDNGTFTYGQEQRGWWVNECWYSNKGWGATRRYGNPYWVHSGGNTYAKRTARVQTPQTTLPKAKEKPAEDDPSEMLPLVVEDVCWGCGGYFPEDELYGNSFCCECFESFDNSGANRKGSSR